MLEEDWHMLESTDAQDEPTLLEKTENYIFKTAIWVDFWRARVDPKIIGVDPWENGVNPKTETVLTASFLYYF